MNPRILALISLISVILLGGCVSTSTVAPVELNIRDFGAVPNDGKNDTPAFDTAIQAAAGLSAPVKIVIPAGTYDLEMPKQAKRKAHLYIYRGTKLTIEGQGDVLLLMKSPYYHGVGIYKATDVVIRGVAVDYDPLPFTQGTVVAVDPKKKLLDFRVDKSFPLPTDPHIDAFSKKGRGGQNVGYTFENASRRKLNQFDDQYLRKQVQSLGNGVYRYQSTNRVDPAMVGKRFAVVGRRKADAFKLQDSNDCLLEDVTAYSAPACGYNVADSSGITINRSAIKQKPGTTRLMSTVADGLHSKWCPVGPTLSNSFFTGMGDDSVNVGGSYVPVVDQVDDHTIIVEVHGSLTKYACDLVGLNLETHGHFPLGPVKEVKGTPRVEGYKRNCLRVVFQNKLPKLLTWKTSKHKRKCSQVLNLNACGLGSKIINNHFYSHRVRGVLMRGPNSLIKGNHFDTLAGPGVVISNDGGFLTEGPSGDGTIVIDNLFTNIERSNIWINSSIMGKTAAATQGVIGVKIINNRFDSYGGANVYGRGVVGNVIFINNADKLLIENNVIGKLSSPDFKASPIILKTNGKVTWNGNVIGDRALDMRKDAVSE